MKMPKCKPLPDERRFASIDDKSLELKRRQLQPKNTVKSDKKCE